jgi:hypothetical protein
LYNIIDLYKNKIYYGSLSAWEGQESIPVDEILDMLCISLIKSANLAKKVGKK